MKPTRSSLVLAVLLISVATRAGAFPLDAAQEKCAGAFTKSSAKVLSISGKESARCHSAIGKGGGGGADDIATCNSSLRASMSLAGEKRGACISVVRYFRTIC